MNSKEKLIQDFLNISEGKSNDDMLPLLMAFSQKAKREKINFSREETVKIIESLTKNMPKDSASKIKTIANLML